MNKFFYVFMLLFCTRLMAGGSWGGGTPPLEYVGPRSATEDRSSFRGAIQKAEAAAMPHLCADSLLETVDGQILLPVHETAFQWIADRIGLAGSAVIILDNGDVFRFHNEKGWPVDSSKSARVINVDKLETKSDSAPRD